jgi:arylsulfatase A-like enzyme
MLCASSCARPPAPPEAVVLVVVDTLRADYLGAYGHEHATSEHLDGWLASARVFERAFATSPWTLPSFGSLFTGQLPSRHGAGELRQREKPRSFAPLEPDAITIAETLAEAGWRTAAIVNNPFLTRSFAIARGFELYDAAPTSSASYRRAEEVVDEALTWIDDHAQQRFFLLVHFFDPHLNYEAPEPFRGRFTAEQDSKLSLPVSGLHEIRSGGMDLEPGDQSFIAAAYQEEIAYTDRALGRLFSELEAREIFARGLVVLASDHGEELFEHGGFEHGHAMWNEVLRVPLAFWGRGIRPGREAKPVSLVDVPVTILEAVGLEPPVELAGHSLWPHLYAGAELPARTLIAEGTLYGPDLKAIVRWPHKLFMETLDPSKVHLFDLEADPEERENLAASEPALVDRLMTELMATVQEAALQRGASRKLRREAEVSEETRQQLRSLGYLD